MKTKTLKLTLLLLTLYMMACSPSKVPSEKGLSSRDIPTEGTRYSTNGLTAMCNGFNSDGIAGYLSEYSVPGLGITEYDKIRLKFSDVPSEITSTDNYRMELRLWHEKVANNQVNDNGPTQFVVKHKSSNYYIGRTPEGQYYFTSDLSQALKFEDFRRSMIDAIVSGIEETYNGYYDLDATEFFNEHQFLMLNVDVNWQAVAMIVYDNSGNAVRYANALLPPYLAHPDAYAATHEAENLQDLHPNWALRGSGMTEEDFYQETNTFCTDMLQ